MSIVDVPGDERICVGNCRVLRRPNVQHPGIVLSIMACMFGNRDWTNVFGSFFRYSEEACRSALVSDDRLSGARMFLHLHTLANLFRLVRRMLCKPQFQNWRLDV
jgi:hypothetical protein